MNESAKYPIKYVSQVTGFSQILLRTWENRYDFVKPKRNKTNRRFYTEEDLRKLMATKKAIDLGYKIGQLSKMTTNEIEELNAMPIDDLIVFTESINFEEIIGLIKAYDSKNLKYFLEQNLIKLSTKKFITELIVPLISKIGDLWHSGELKISHEHFASSTIENILYQILEYPDNDNASSVVFSTTSGQKHTLMLLALAALTSTYGFNVIYLGASTPSSEIISTVNRTNAIAVILSLIYPADDYRVIDELKMLSRNIKNSEIIIGGSAAKIYNKSLNSSKIKYLDDIDEMLSLLNSRRNKKAPA